MQINVATQYLKAHSNPSENKHVFSYTISIKNTRNESAQLISRYWHICDSNNQIQEVEGLGVIGKQPIIEPQAKYIYSSGTVLATAFASMHGHYIFQLNSGEEFKANIPAFSLAIPNSIH